MSVDKDVYIIRWLPSGTLQSREVPESLFLTGTLFREGWASMEDRHNAIQDMFYAQEVDKTLKEKFGALPATEALKLASPVWIVKMIPNKEVVPSRQVPYGDFLENWSKTGWELADIVPTFHFNSRAAKITAMNRLREQGWWKPRRTMAYAHSLALRYGLPLKPYIYEKLTDPRNHPNPKYDYYRSKILPWILKENPQDALDISYGLNSGSAIKARRAIQRQNELFDIGEKYFYDAHHLRRPEPVIDEEQAREQNRRHKKRNPLYI